MPSNIIQRTHVPHSDGTIEKPLFGRTVCAVSSQYPPIDGYPAHSISARQGLELPVRCDYLLN
jgi:hypothetical protein